MTVGGAARTPARASTDAILRLPWLSGGAITAAMVEDLIAAGADPAFRGALPDTRGTWTPATCAIVSGNTDALRVLAPSCRDDASVCGCAAVCDRSDHLDILVAAGHDPDAVDPHHDDPSDAFMTHPLLRTASHGTGRMGPMLRDLLRHGSGPRSIAVVARARRTIEPGLLQAIHGLSTTCGPRGRIVAALWHETRFGGHQDIGPVEAGDRDWCARIAAANTEAPWLMRFLARVGAAP